MVLPARSISVSWMPTAAAPKASRSDDSAARGAIGGDAQRGDVGRGVRLSEAAREPRFDELPGDVEIPCGRAPQLQCDGQALGERVDPGHGDDRPTSASTADLEESLRLEDSQPLAERGAGDAELSGQLVLRWEPLTDGQLAAGDLASQPLGDDLAGLRHPDLLVRRALIRAVHCHDFDAIYCPLGPLRASPFRDK